MTDQLQCSKRHVVMCMPAIKTPFPLNDNSPHVAVDSIRAGTSDSHNISDGSQAQAGMFSRRSSVHDFVRCRCSASSGL